MSRYSIAHCSTVHITVLYLRVQRVGKEAHDFCRVLLCVLGLLIPFDLLLQDLVIDIVPARNATCNSIERSKRDKNQMNTEQWMRLGYGPAHDHVR